MKNDAICGKNPRGIFTINVLILNPHGSRHVEKTVKHYRMAATLVDFRSIGLDFVWKNSTLNHSKLSNEPELIMRLADVDDSNLPIIPNGVNHNGQPKFQFAVETPAVPAAGIPAILSRIVMNGRTYVVRENKGSGVFGIVARVEELPLPGAAPGTPSRVFALKRQDTAASDFLTFIREGVIHYTLYSRTRDPATGESAHVPNFYYMGKSANPSTGQPQYMYFLTELMENTLDGGHIRPTMTNLGVQPGLIVDFLRQITPILQFLYNDCNFNHGDFKTDNVMYNAAGQYKLIDFGFSRLKIQGRVIETQHEYCNFSEESRDLSQMIRTIVDGTQMAYYYAYHGVGAYTLANKLDKILTYTVLNNAICDGKDGHHEEHFSSLMHPHIDWVGTYLYFNAPAPPPGVVPVPPAVDWHEGHRNMAGTFDAITGYLAWINTPESDVPAAPAPLTPADIATLTAVATNPASFDAGRAAAILAALAAPAPPAAPPAAAATPVVPIVIAPPSPGLLDIIRENAGALAIGVILTTIGIVHAYIAFNPELQEGGKKVKRRTQKNRRRVQRHVNKRKSRKQRSY